MNTPTIIELCDAATKEEANRHNVFVDQRLVGITVTPAQARLHARLSPETVWKIFQNLDRIESICDAESEIHILANECLRLLDGHNPEVK